MKNEEIVDCKELFALTYMRMHKMMNATIAQHAYYDVLV